MTWLLSVRDRYRVAVDPLRTERRIELAVLLAALLFFLQLGYGAFRLAIMSTPDPVLPTADSLQVQRPLSLSTITDEQSNDIRNRPLLWPARRPLETVGSESVGENVQEQEFKDIKLLGVFGSGASVGIIARVNNNIRRLHLGEDVGGWKLKSVRGSDVVFTAGSRQAKLVLQHEPIQPAGKVNRKSEGR
ncbi:MAG TPA: hypothetical protein VIV27_06750 [Halioglobus sp.]